MLRQRVLKKKKSDFNININIDRYIASVNLGISQHTTVLLL